MSTAKNADVAEFLENIADTLEVKGESIFRVRAYRDAARKIETLQEDIGGIVKKDGLCDIPGIGESIAIKVREYVETGQSSYYNELKKQVRPGMAEMLTIPGIGPAKARIFSEQLGVDSIEKLEQAAREHQISAIPTLGARTEQNILEAIERIRGRSGRIPLRLALPTALALLDEVCEFPEITHGELAGSLRRRVETIGDLDLIASSDQPEAVIDRFVKLPTVKSVLGHGPTKGSIVTDDNLQVDLRVVKNEEYGAGLQYFTGSKAHNIKLRSIAESKGLKVNEYGVFRVADDVRVAGDTEESVYAALGLPWIPPEIREDKGEIEAALENNLPHLIDRHHIKGDMHVHTDWSDGSDSPEAMVRAAAKMGYEYIVLSDHSVSMGFVHGLTPERVQEQREAIKTLNCQYTLIRVLHGIEVNIRVDGTLDYPDEILEAFDVVTASIHSGMNMPADKMTERIIKAIRNPHVDILAHPTGRQIGKREPYAVDLEAVFQAAAETGTAMEISAQPDRLDLKDTDARLAKRMGVMVTINSDAHAANQLSLIDYGIENARRGWIEPENVLNALPLEKLICKIGISQATRVCRVA